MMSLSDAARALRTANTDNYFFRLTLAHHIANGQRKKRISGEKSHNKSWMD